MFAWFSFSLLLPYPSVAGQSGSGLGTLYQEGIKHLVNNWRGNEFSPRRCVAKVGWGWGLPRGRDQHAHPLLLLFPRSYPTVCLPFCLCPSPWHILPRLPPARHWSAAQRNSSVGYLTPDFFCSFQLCFSCAAQLPRSILLHNTWANASWHYKLTEIKL